MQGTFPLGATIATLLLVTAGGVGAQSISTPVVTKNGPTNTDTADLDRISTATLVTNSTAAFTARMFGIHLYDVIEFTSGAATDTQANDYQVDFNVTAPGDYQLNISTHYSACMRTVDDTVFGGTATGTAGAVTGSTPVGPGVTK